MSSPGSRHDLTIIGGGIIGAMVSHYAFRKAPEATQIIFERYKVASGSTYLSGGLMPLIGPTQEALALAERSRLLYGGLITDLPNVPVARRPTYWIFPWERTQELFEALGRNLSTQAVIPEALRNIHPHLVLPQGYLIAADDSTWVADPALLTRRLVEAGSARRTLAEGVSVESLERDGDGFALHRSDGITTRSRRVILAPGPWVLHGPTMQWAKEREIQLKRTVCLHLAGNVADDAPVLIFYAERAFMLPIPRSDRSLFNYTADEWGVKPIIGEMKITGRDRSIALGILECFLPRRVADYTGGQVFCDAYAPGRFPKVEMFGPDPGCVIVGGCSGSGVRFAPGLAERAVELAWHQ